MPEPAPSPAPDSPAPSAAGSPDWIAESARNALAELRLFFRTVAAFTLAPGRFAAAWRSGQQRALNPLAFLATSAALLGGLRALFNALFRTADDGTLWSQIADAAGPYAHYAALGLIAHLVFRLLGSRSVRVRDSLAMALFAGGGPAALAEVAMTAVAGAYLSVNGTAAAHVESKGWGLALALTAGGVFSVFSWAFATALVALHGTGSAARRFASITVALLAAFAATGLFFGAVQPRGHYGLHWELKLGKGADGKRAVNIGLRG